MIGAHFFSVLRLILVCVPFFFSSVRADENISVPSPKCIGADLVHFQKDNYEFANTLDNCSGYSGLDIECVRKIYPISRLSDGCLSCFSDMTYCTVTNCAFRCLFSGRRSLACKQCSIDNCGKAMQACSGVDPDKWPDFQRKRLLSIPKMFCASGEPK